MDKTYAIPISVKGIVFEHDRVWLRKNEREEWELPGGKIDRGEQPEETVVREVDEELGFRTEVQEIISATVYTINSTADEQHGVLVISYLCKIISKTGKFETIGEAGKAEFQKFAVEDIEALNMPEFYKKAITKAYDKAG